MKVLVCLLALVAAASSRSAYRFPDGYLDVLGGEPIQSFDCTGRPYGYYADIANDCRVFHVCLPISNEAGEVVDMAHFSFLCGNQTIFNQEFLTCSHPEDSPACVESENLFGISNADFGTILEYDGAVDTSRGTFDVEANNELGGLVEVVESSDVDLDSDSVPATDAPIEIESDTDE